MATLESRQLSASLAVAAGIALFRTFPGASTDPAGQHLSPPPQPHPQRCHHPNGTAISSKTSATGTTLRRTTSTGGDSPVVHLLLEPVQQRITQPEVKKVSTQSQFILDKLMVEPSCLEERSYVIFRVNRSRISAVLPQEKKTGKFLFDLIVCEWLRSELHQFGSRKPHVGIKLAILSLKFL